MSKRALLPAPAVAPAPPPVQVRQISLPTNDLVHDPVSRLLFVSVPSSAGPIGNSVIPIDPATGVVGPSIWVGSEPYRLAVSDDGQYLYVGLDGEGAVRRFDLASGSAGPRFSLGGDAESGLKYQAADLKVLPGEPRAFAVARDTRTGWTNSFKGIAIFDDGIQRPDTVDGTRSGPFIEFGASAATLYSTAWGDFFRIEVGTSGASPAFTARRLAGGWAMKYGGGLLYTGFGRVIHPESARLLGTFPIGDPASMVLPDRETGRVYFVKRAESWGMALHAFDRSTYLPLWSISIPDAMGWPTNLLRWGKGGLAFRTTQGQVFVIELATSQAPRPN